MEMDSTKGEPNQEVSIRMSYEEGLILFKGLVDVYRVKISEAIYPAVVILTTGLTSGDVRRLTLIIAPPHPATKPEQQCPGGLSEMCKRCDIAAVPAESGTCELCGQHTMVKHPPCIDKDICPRCLVLLDKIGFQARQS